MGRHGRTSGKGEVTMCSYIRSRGNGTVERASLVTEHVCPVPADACHVPDYGENDEPVLLRDPTTLLLHFSLILPVQIDRAFFTTIVRQVYNLCWTQACLKLACRLPNHHRTVLRDEWRRQANTPGNHMKVDTLAAGLGIIISNLDASGLFNDDVDHPRGPSADSLPHDVTFDQLEARLQANCLPYLRIASLLRHYIYG